MPIIRKIRTTGDSYSITLPKSWLTNLERENRQRITELAIEVNGILKVSPVLRQEISK
jgi:antitoxin component of MazEF toxin-antitoxin module